VRKRKIFGLFGRLRDKIIYSILAVYPLLLYLIFFAVFHQFYFEALGFKKELGLIESRPYLFDGCLGDEFYLNFPSSIENLCEVLKVNFE